MCVLADIVERGDCANAHTFASGRSPSWQRMYFAISDAVERIAPAGAIASKFHNVARSPSSV
jgi:hypothetical protein